MDTERTKEAVARFFIAFPSAFRAHYSPNEFAMCTGAVQRDFPVCNRVRCRNAKSVRGPLDIGVARTTLHSDGGNSAKLSGGRIYMHISWLRKKRFSKERIKKSRPCF